MKQLFAVAIAAGLALTGEPAEVTALVDQVHTNLSHAYGVFHFLDDDRELLNHSEKDSRELLRNGHSCGTCAQPMINMRLEELTIRCPST